MRGSRGLTAALAVAAAAGVIGGGALVVNLTSARDTVSGTPGAAERTGPERGESGGGNGAGGASSTRAGADYLVFYELGRKDEAVEAVRRAGGTPGTDNAALGYLVVRQAPAGFPEKVGESPAVVGVTANSRIGATAAAARRARTLPGGGPRYAPIVETGVRAARKAGPVRLTPRRPAARRVEPEPLAGRQWDMRMIGATATGSLAKAPGKKKVLVGIIDTGVDGRHPDIAPNFDRELSRNFVVDIPTDERGETVDGPCEVASCRDPVDVDDDGHGTHVAGTVAAPINGLGIAGVAPEVTLVSLRAGQDSGFFFLKPSMDALVYAGDTGIDVVNMSFYVDPWLFNCASPGLGGSRAEQLEQAGIVVGMQRALDYARKRGVTLISALGNGATDLGKVVSDDTSPDYPKNSERQRKIDNTCITLPTEAEGVISVSAVGPAGRKAQYSDYGIEQTDLSAPGGDTFDLADGGIDYTKGVLGPAPEAALRANGKLTADGRPKDESVVRECRGGTCAYYQYLEGTSMAAPHATGVAAILISRFGTEAKGGFGMDPAEVERLLYASAVPRPCPTPREVRYPGDDVQVCEGDAKHNGFFGRGLVSAARAATIEP